MAGGDVTGALWGAFKESEQSLKAVLLHLVEPSFLKMFQEAMVGLHSCL